HFSRRRAAPRAMQKRSVSPARCAPNALLMRSKTMSVLAFGAAYPSASVANLSAARASRSAARLRAPSAAVPSGGLTREGDSHRRDKRRHEVPAPDLGGARFARARSRILGGI